MRSAEAVAIMPCPICKTGLTLSDRSGVEIDYCQTCRGVWLDRGELDKIIERTGAPTAREMESREGPARSAGPGGLMGMAASMLKGDDNRYDRDRDDRYRDGRYDDRYDHRRKKKKSILSEFFD